MPGFMSTRPIGRAMTAAVLLAGGTMAAPPARAGDWIADKSGCRVWNPNPQLEETVTWSGSCANGHAEGQGIVRWLKSDLPIETDVGEWHDGRQASKGTQTWPGGRYDGELADGEPNGHGVLTVQKLKYDGEFRNGKPNGPGTLTANGETVQGIWKDGCLQGQRKASIGIPLSSCR